MSQDTFWKHCKIPLDGEFSITTIFQESCKRSPTSKTIIYESENRYFLYPDVDIKNASSEYYDYLLDEFLVQGGFNPTDDHPNYGVIKGFIDGRRNSQSSPTSFYDYEERKRWRWLLGDYYSEDKEWAGFDHFVKDLTDKDELPNFSDNDNFSALFNQYKDYYIKPLFNEFFAIGSKHVTDPKLKISQKSQNIGLDFGALHYKIQYVLFDGFLKNYSLIRKNKANAFSEMIDFFSKNLLDSTDYLHLFLFLDGYESYYIPSCRNVVEKFHARFGYEQVLCFPKDQIEELDTTSFAPGANVLIGSNADCQNNLDDVLKLLLELHKRGFEHRGQYNGCLAGGVYEFAEVSNSPDLTDYYLYSVESKLIAIITSSSISSNKLQVNINSQSAVKLGGTNNLADWADDRKYRWISTNELGSLIRRFKLTSYGYGQRSKIGIGQISGIQIDIANKGTGYFPLHPPGFNITRKRNVTCYSEDPNIVGVISKGKIISAKVLFGGSGFLQPKGYVLGGTGLSNSINQPGQIRDGSGLETEVSLTFANGKVDAASIVAPHGSSNYSTPPILMIHGGNMDASGSFTLDSLGKLNTINIPTSSQGSGYAMCDDVTISPPPKYKLVETDTINRFSLKFIDFDYCLEAVPFETGDAATLYQSNSSTPVEINVINSKVELLDQNGNSLSYTPSDGDYLQGVTASVSNVEYSISPLWDRFIGPNGLQFENRTQKDNTKQYTVDESLSRSLIQHFADGDPHKLALILSQFKTEFGDFGTSFESGNYSINSGGLRHTIEDLIKYARFDEETETQNARNNIRIQIEAKLIQEQDLDAQSDWPMPKSHDGYDQDFVEKWKTTTHSLYDSNGNFSFDKNTNLANLTKDECEAEVTLHLDGTVKYLVINDVQDLDHETTNTLRFKNIFVPNEDSNEVKFKKKRSDGTTSTHNLVDYIARNNNSNFPKIPQISLKKKSENENYYSIEVDGEEVELISLSTTSQTNKIRFIQYVLHNPSKPLTKAACYQGFFDNSRKKNGVKPRYLAKYRGRGFIQATHPGNYGKYNLGPFTKTVGQPGVQGYQESQIQTKPTMLAYFSILGGEWSMQFLNDKKFSFCRLCNIVHSSPSWSGCGNSGHITTQHRYWGFSILSPQQDTFLDDDGNRKFSDIDYPGISGLSYRVYGSRNAIKDNKRAKHFLSSLLSIFHHSNGFSLSKEEIHTKTGEYILSKGESAEKKRLLRYFSDRECVLYPHDHTLLSNLTSLRWIKFPNTGQFSNFIENKTISNSWCTDALMSVLIFLGKKYHEKTNEKLIIISLSPEFGGWDGMHSDGYEHGLDACIQISSTNKSKLEEIIRNGLDELIDADICISLMNDKIESFSSTSGDTFYRLSILPASAGDNSKEIWSRREKE